MKGITLVELMITIVIGAILIGSLTFISTQIYSVYQTTSQELMVLNELEPVSITFQTFAADAMEVELLDPHHIRFTKTDDTVYELMYLPDEDRLAGITPDAPTGYQVIGDITSIEFGIMAEAVCSMQIVLERNNVSIRREFEVLARNVP